MCKYIFAAFAAIALTGCHHRQQQVVYVQHVQAPAYNPPYHTRPDPRYGYRRQVIVHHVVHVVHHR